MSVPTKRGESGQWTEAASAFEESECGPQLKRHKPPIGYFSMRASMRGASSSTEIVGIMFEPILGKISCEILSRSKVGGVSMGVGSAWSRPKIQRLGLDVSSNIRIQIGTGIKTVPNPLAVMDVLDRSTGSPESHTSGSVLLGKSWTFSSSWLSTLW